MKSIFEITKNKLNQRGNDMSILNGQHDVSVNNQVLMVTPEKAKTWLEKNTNNRNLQKKGVQKLVNDIKAGRWVFNGESIKFDKNGCLIDGQHRLAAIVESGVALPLLVVNNLDTHSQQTIDIGRARTTADMVRLLQIPNPNVIAAAANVIIRFDRNYNVLWQGWNAPTKTEVTQFIQNNSGELQFAAQFGRAAKTYVGIRESVYTAFAFEVMKSSQFYRFEDFHEGLCTGSNLQVGDPRLTLRNQTMRDRGMGTKNFSQQQAMAWTVKSWNNWLIGKPLKILRFTKDSLPMPKVH